MMEIVHRSSFHAARRLGGGFRRALGLSLLLCVVVAMAAQQWVARDDMRRRLAQSAADHGRQIAQALEQAGTSPQRRDAILQSYFDDHRLQRLEWIDASGQPGFQRLGATPEAQLPKALSELWAVHASAVETLVGPRLGGRLRVEVGTDEASAELWRQSWRFAAALALAALAAWAVGLWALRGLRRELAESNPSSSSFKSGFGATSTGLEPTVASDAPQASAKQIRKLAKLEGLLATQARELEALRRSAHVDELTGLPRRGDAMVRLEQALDGDAAWPVAGLMLLRVRDLAGLNQRLGHEMANELLRTVARAVKAQSEFTDASIAGRLNGSDFVLLLPYANVTRSVATSLLATLKQAWEAVDAAGGLAVGAVELNGRVGAKQAMALADEALARAESEPPFALSVIEAGPDKLAFAGSVWQQRLAVALAQRRVVLAAYPVLGRGGGLLHLDCPMHVQFEDGGEFEPASRWLAPAARGPLGAQIDRRVVQMALAAIAEDGTSRCVNIAPQSMASSDFMVDLTRELEAAPEAAHRLWIDIDESVAVDQPGLVREAARRWRPLGVCLALEHAGERLGRIENLRSLGLDCVRVDGRFVRGLTGPDSAGVRQHLQALVRLVHDAGLTITAEGVALAGDLAVLWTMGFDAATGPAVLKRGHSISPQ